MKVYVTSCTRRADSVGRTLRSLKASGFSDVTVLVDDSGAFANFRSALETVAGQANWEEPILVSQDDVVFCRHIPDLLRAILWPSKSTGALSLYSARNPTHSPSRLLQRAHTANAEFGACAIVLPVCVARLLVEMEAKTPWKPDCMVDVFLWVYLKEAGLDQWVMVPSLVQHVGVTSTISDATLTDDRIAPTFVGEHVDARMVGMSEPKGHRLSYGESGCDSSGVE